MDTKSLYTTVRELVKKHEGLSLKPYKDTVGKLTIGYGRNLEDKGITQSEAEFLLENDLKEVYGDLESIFGRDIWTIDIDRIAALADMRFNLGAAGFRKFKKLIAVVKERDWNKAVQEVRDSLWYSQVKTRGEDIVKLLQSGGNDKDE